VLTVHVSSVAQDARASKLTGVLEQLDNIALTGNPAEAEVIVMTDDDARLIAASPVFHSYRAKCVSVSDGDVLNYYLPALYAANRRSWLSYGRAFTTGPFTSLFYVRHGSRNPWIDRLQNEEVDKRYLYSFMGGSTCFLRKRMLKHYRCLDIPDALVACTDHYRHWSTEITPEKSDQQRRYVETMLASKFVLCPRGASDASIRLFEAMELGCVPVVIADRWVPVDGVDWSFCIFVKEAQIFEVDAIVRAHEPQWQERGMAAKRAFEAHFAPATFGQTTERQLRHLVRHRNEARERLIQAFYPLYRGSREAKWRIRRQLRSAVLAGFRLLGRKFPYDLNR
jgi:hypothetical protein